MQSCQPWNQLDKNQTCSMARQDILPCPDVSVKHKVSETSLPICADFIYPLRRHIPKPEFNLLLHLPLPDPTPSMPGKTYFKRLWAQKLTSRLFSTLQDLTSTAFKHPYATTYLLWAFQSPLKQQDQFLVLEKSCLFKASASYLMSFHFPCTLHKYWAE